MHNFLRLSALEYFSLSLSFICFSDRIVISALPFSYSMLFCFFFRSFSIWKIRNNATVSYAMRGILLVFDANSNFFNDETTYSQHRTLHLHSPTHFPFRLIDISDCSRKNLRKMCRERYLMMIVSMVRSRKSEAKGDTHCHVYRSLMDEQICCSS